MSEPTGDPLAADRRQVMEMILERRMQIMDLMEGYANAPLETADQIQFFRRMLNGTHEELTTFERDFLLRRNVPPNFASTTDRNYLDFDEFYGVETEIPAKEAPSSSESSTAVRKEAEATVEGPVELSTSTIVSKAEPEIETSDSNDTTNIVGAMQELKTEEPAVVSEKKVAQVIPTNKPEEEDPSRKLSETSLEGPSEKSKKKNKKKGSNKRGESLSSGHASEKAEEMVKKTFKELREEELAAKEAKKEAEREKRRIAREEKELQRRLDEEKAKKEEAERKVKEIIKREQDRLDMERMEREEQQAIHEDVESLREDLRNFVFEKICEVRLHYENLLSDPRQFDAELGETMRNCVRIATSRRHNQTPDVLTDALNIAAEANKKLMVFQRFFVWARTIVSTASYLETEQMYITSFYTSFFEGNELDDQRMINQSFINERVKNYSNNRTASEGLLYRLAKTFFKTRHEYYKENPQRYENWNMLEVFNKIATYFDAPQIFAAIITRSFCPDRNETLRARLEESVVIQEVHNFYESDQEQIMEDYENEKKKKEEKAKKKGGEGGDEEGQGSSTMQ